MWAPETVRYRTDSSGLNGDYIHFSQEIIRFEAYSCLGDLLRISPQSLLLLEMDADDGSNADEPG